MLVLKSDKEKKVIDNMEIIELKFGDDIFLFDMSSFDRKLIKPRKNSFVPKNNPVDTKN